MRQPQQVTLWPRIYFIHDLKNIVTGWKKYVKFFLMSKPPIIRSDDLRAENRLRVLDVLRKLGSSTRADLGELTSLSAAAISTLTTSLSNDGIVASDQPSPGSSVEKQRGRRGRPQYMLHLDPLAARVVNAIFTIDRLQVRLLDYRGDEISAVQQEFDSRQLGEKELLNILASAIDDVLSISPTSSDSSTSSSRLHHIGVGFQGITEHASGNVLWSPILSVESLPLGSFLESRYSVPVTVHNDCRLIAKALHHEHAQTLGETFATVLFSHGVGLGLYIDGQPFAGHASSALEIGHLLFQRNGALCRCGKMGCIEAYAADYGVKRLYAGERIDDQPQGRVSGSELAEIVNAGLHGEESAIQSFAIAGAAVGYGLSQLFTLLDPMPIAILGRSREGLELMRPALQDALASSMRDPQQALNMIHCFDDADPFLLDGLALESLTAVDRQFAYNQVNVRDAS